jgi:hypothetical protein
MRTPPSRWSIVWTDNACYQMVVFPPGFFLFALMVKLTGTWPGGRGRPNQPVDPEFANLFLVCTSGMLAFLWSIIALRVARIRDLFDSGEEVEATVAKVSRFRGGSTLKLEYELEGTTYRVRSSFQGSSRIPTFTVGDRIVLLVDGMHPKRAVPIALYANDSSGATASGRAAGERPSAATAGPKKLGL